MNDNIVSAPAPNGPQPAAKLRNLLLACGSCLLLAVIGIGVGTYALVRNFNEMMSTPVLEGMGDMPEQNRAGLKIGDRPQWRVLPYRPKAGLGRSYLMRSMDYDGDGSRELVFYQEFAFMESPVAEVVDINGSVVARFNLPEARRMEDLVFWDFDGDGCDEAVHSDYSDTIVSGRDGAQLHMFAGYVLPEGRVTADCDGDGDDELLLTRDFGGGFILVDKGGVELQRIDSFEEKLGKGMTSVLLADLDADGRSSVFYNWFTEFHILDADGTEQHYEVDEYIDYAHMFYELAIDVNGDGVSEFFGSSGDFYDPSSGYYGEMELPEGVDGFYNLADRRSVRFDLDRDGEWELCCLPDLYESELVACNLDGSLSYHEAFGKSCGGLVVLEENGMEHLLILVGNEVRIYP